jgi:APA family basic amino acid/polyamine antiporter
MSQLFRRKPIAALLVDEADTAHSLKRVLGAGDLVMLAIGAVIGAGIFGAIGTAAAGQVGPDGVVIRYGAGPALVFSFLLLGAACALAALCYAELAAMIPQAGSAYAYTYATLGELVAWIIGWDLILEYAVGNVAVAISWGDYFNTLVRGVGINLPAWLTTGYRTRAAQLERASTRAARDRAAPGRHAHPDQHPRLQHRGPHHVAAACGARAKAPGRTTSWW